MAGSNESCLGCLCKLAKFILVRLIFIIHCFIAYYAVTEKFGVVNPFAQPNDVIILHIISVKNLQAIAAVGFLLLILEVVISSYLRSIDQEQFTIIIKSSLTST